MLTDAQTKKVQLCVVDVFQYLSDKIQRGVAGPADLDAFSRIASALIAAEKRPGRDVIDNIKARLEQSGSEPLVL